MQKFTTTAVLLSALSAQALAQYGGSGSTSSMTAATTVASSSSPTHTVQVGADGLVFTPDSVTAAMGDMLEFHFTGSSHDVVSGTFSSPCADNSDIYSSYPASGDVFQVMVNSTSPMWLYCSTPGHCQGGMAMVVNEDSSSSKTLAAYKSAAKGTSSSSAPPDVMGGTVVASSALSAGSSASGSMASATSSAAAATSSSASGSGAAETISSPIFRNIVLAVGIPALVWLI